MKIINIRIITIKLIILIIFSIQKYNNINAIDTATTTIQPYQTFIGTYHPVNVSLYEKYHFGSTVIVNRDSEAGGAGTLEDDIQWHWDTQCRRNRAVRASVSVFACPVRRKW